MIDNDILINGIEKKKKVYLLPRLYLFIKIFTVLS